jgi:hypothetical protein
VTGRLKCGFAAALDFKGFAAEAAGEYVEKAQCGIGE